MSGPLDLDAVLTEFNSALVERRRLGPLAWVAWRRWRAEWTGRVHALQWEVDHYRDASVLRTPVMGRTLEAVLQELADAVAMQTLLDDVAAAIKWLTPKP